MAKLDWLLEKLKQFDPANPDPNCWNWPYSKNPAGRGQVNVGGISTLVPRVAASVHFGLDLKDSKILVMHKCDNSSCFNPSHLELGNKSRNAADYHSRKHPGFCTNGHELTAENFYYHVNGGYCKICHRESNRRKS